MGWWGGRAGGEENGDVGDEERGGVSDGGAEREGECIGKGEEEDM